LESRFREPLIAIVRPDTLALNMRLSMARFAIAFAIVTMAVAAPARADEQLRRPSTPPPEFAFATVLEDGTLKLEHTRFSVGHAPREMKAIEVEKVIDGKPVRQKQVIFETWKSFEPDHATIMFRGGFEVIRSGVKLDAAAAKEALKHRTEVVVAEWGAELDPFYVQFLKPDVTVLVLDNSTALGEDKFPGFNDLVKRKKKELDAQFPRPGFQPDPLALPLQEPEAGKDEPLYGP
jgi:hypothetical protein